MERLIDYFNEQLNNNMEMRFYYNNINYHLDYDSDNNSQCYVFNENTGTIYYEGNKEDILDNFVINGKTFRSSLLSEVFELYI